MLIVMVTGAMPGAAVNKGAIRTSGSDLAGNNDKFCCE